MNCLFIGTIAKDLLMLVAEPPQSDRRIEAVRIAESCGGPAATAAHAFSSLGGQAGLITAVGTDGNAPFAETEARRIAGSRLQLFAEPGGTTSFSVIQVEADGKRCITHFGGCIGALNPAELDSGLLAWADMIHLAGMKDHQIVAVARACRERSRARLSADGGNLGGKALLALSRCVDILIPDHKTVRKSLGLEPEAACQRFAEGGTALSCVTMGERGLVALWEGQALRLPAYSVPVVDTTGAGDNFHGALLFALSQAYPPQRALAFASAYSALTCTGLGGQTASPSREDTLRLMENGSQFE